MDIIRRNTDYALRAMVHLAAHYGEEVVSTKKIAEEQDFSYALASKLMQRLQKAGLIESIMGVRGGFQLARDPAQISLLDVIEAIQGPISLNRCMLGVKVCKRHGTCPIRKRLGLLQSDMTAYLEDTSLGDLMELRES
jgi:Rrf2 family protein